MALSNVSDYQLAVNQLLYYIENVCGGIDRDRIPVFTGMLPEDFKTIMDAYSSPSSKPLGQAGYEIDPAKGYSYHAASGYKKTRADRPTSSELAPNSHGTNKTTYADGSAAGKHS